MPPPTSLIRSVSSATRRAAGPIVCPGDDLAGPVSAPEGLGLPAHWPSAWPSLWRPIRDRAIFVLLTSALVVLGLARFGDLGLAWWVALLPLSLLVGPLSRPGRARRTIQRAAQRRTLNVRASADELCVTARRRSVTAWVASDGGVTYQVGRFQRGEARSWR